MKKIGIMGGVFDPIHNGHLITAEKVREAFQLDTVVFIPSGMPPHKKERKIAASEHRLKMTELAVAGKPYFTVSDMEIRREGYSYALDTVEEFYRIYGDNIDLYFITGTDAAAEIAGWHKADELMAKCRFIAAARPGYGNGTEFPAKYKDRIIPFTETALEISSSAIREKLRKGQDIAAEVPASVAEYIKTHHLYTEE